MAASASADEANGGGDADPGSEAVGRYVRRPLWWVPLALFLGVLIYGSELQDVRDDERAYGRGDPLVGTVDESYDGGDRVPVVYRHPHFGAVRSTIGLSRSDDPGELAPGDPIALRAAREDPFAVRLPRDDPERPAPALTLLFVAPFLAATARRWWTARRTHQLVSPADLGPDPAASDGASDTGRSDDGDGGATFTRMRGRLRPRGQWRAQTVVLDLFPWGADARGTAACSVPLVSSLGLPLDSPATFPVRVHGRPRRLGRVVAEVPDGVLWPRRRALLLPQWFRGAWRAGDAGPEPVAALRPRTLRAPKQTWPAPRGRVRAAAVVLALAVVVGVLATVSTLRAADQADELPPGSIEVPAEVVGEDGGRLQVAFRLPTDEGTQPAEGESTAEGEGGRVTSELVVADPVLWAEGTPLLVVVDPDYLVRVQLPPRPYRAAEPLVWGWAPALVAGLWLLRTLRWWGRVEQAAVAEPWYRVDVDPVGRTTLLVSRPGAASPSCLVSLPPSYDQPPPAIGRTLSRGAQVYAQPLPAPGARVALRFGGTVVASPTAALARDRPWRRRLRGLLDWLQLPARLRPT